VFFFHNIPSESSFFIGKKQSNPSSRVFSSSVAEVMSFTRWEVFFGLSVLALTMPFSAGVTNLRDGNNLSLQSFFYLDFALTLLLLV